MEISNPILPENESEATDATDQQVSRSKTNAPKPNTVFRVR